MWRTAPVPSPFVAREHVVELKNPGEEHGKSVTLG